MLQEPNILDAHGIQLVAERAAELMRKEPNVLTLHAPTVVSLPGMSYLGYKPYTVNEGG